MTTPPDPANKALPSPPFDSISKVRFSPVDSSQLLVSSWDTTVRFYTAGDASFHGAEQRAKFDHRAAVLDCCFADRGHAFSGGLDTAVRYFDLEKETTNVLGSHNEPVSAMCYVTAANALVTGSWDRTIRLWDIRTPPSSPENGGALKSTTPTPERVYHMDVANGHHTIIVAMASRLFHLYDVRKMDMPAQERESSLKYMTRSLGVMGGGEGYAVGSVEGRIAVEYLDSSPEVQAQKYAFKCHRQAVGNVDHVWPVNAIAFHPVHNTFASGGSDGTVSIWDHKVKKRLRQYPRFNNAVASLAMSHDGGRLAVGTSYTWDEGEEGQKKVLESPMIWVRNLGDEVKAKDK